MLRAFFFVICLFSLGAGGGGVIRCAYEDEEA